MVVSTAAGMVMVELGALLLGLLGIAVLLKRRSPSLGPGAAPRSIRLTAEHALHVVELPGRTLVVGTGPGGPPTLLETREGTRTPSAASETSSQHTDPSAPGWDLDARR